jgi:hypothetical protein
MSETPEKPLSLDSSFPESTPAPSAPVPAATPEPPKGSAFTPRLVLGIGIIMVGVILTLNNLPGFGNYSHLLLRLWPLVLVFMGLAKLRQDGSKIGGGLMTAAGLYFLALTLGGHDLGEAIGPMLLVAFGIFVVVQALKRHRGPRPEGVAHDDMLMGTAIFGGVKRRPVSQTFRGGEVTAIFGGFEADLRGAALADGHAVLDLFLLFGGGEIRVPAGWDLDIRATALFGAIEDKTSHLIREEGQASRPRLTVTGLVLFGGCEIKD